jgi:hypothetical protein
MLLKWGSYPFTANECDVKARSEVKKAGGKPYARRTSMHVAGRFYCSGQSDATSKQNALINALAVNYQDLILYQDDNAVSATLLTSAGSFGGVVITDGPNFEENEGAEYATQRSFSFTAEAEYPFSGTDNILLSFEETLSFSGGGPKVVFRPNVYGPFQKQTVYPQTTYKVVQSGSAVGYKTRPAIPPPIWPADENRDMRESSAKTPERMALRLGNYAVSWTYHFESINPLIGSPNIWPAGK